jgi:hypothetical protein
MAMARDDAATARPADPTAGSGWAGAVPSLGARTVVGVFSDAAAVEQTYRDLSADGFRAEDISVVRQGDPAPQMGAGETKSATGAATGATAGAVLGGIAGLAALAIPGVGPFLAAGPIATALGAALTGGALGGLVGSFAGLGMPTEHARDYEAAVRGGGTFISVKTEDEAAGRRVEELLRRHGADKVSSYQPAL